MSYFYIKNKGTPYFTNDICLLQTNPADVAALKNSDRYSVVFRMLVSQSENDHSSTHAPTKFSGNFIFLISYMFNVLQRMKVLLEFCVVS